MSVRATGDRARARAQAEPGRYHETSVETGECTDAEARDAVPWGRVGSGVMRCNEVVMQGLERTNAMVGAGGDDNRCIVNTDVTLGLACQESRRSYHWSGSDRAPRSAFTRSPRCSRPMPPRPGSPGGGSADRRPPARRRDSRNGGTARTWVWAAYCGQGAVWGSTRVRLTIHKRVSILSTRMRLARHMRLSILLTRMRLTIRTGRSRQRWCVFDRTRSFTRAKGTSHDTRASHAHTSPGCGAECLRRELNGSLGGGNFPLGFSTRRISPPPPGDGVNAQVTPSAPTARSATERPTPRPPPEPRESSCTFAGFLPTRAVEMSNASRTTWAKSFAGSSPRGSAGNAVSRPSRSAREHLRTYA